MNVETTNLISKVVLTTAMEAGAVAGAAAWLASPIGPIGGAIFGTVRCLSQIPLGIFAREALNTANPRASSAANTLGVALQFFGSYAAAWAVLAAAGFSLTLAHMVTLGFVSIFTMILIGVAMNCLDNHQVFHLEATLLRRPH